MLVGGHVSTAGGLVKTHGRAVEFGMEAIQVFNQSPRMWRPTAWKAGDVEEFRALIDGGPVKSVVIHASYLINLAAHDEVREKSLQAMVHALRAGESIGAAGVVVHPGSAKKDPVPEAIGRISDGLRFLLGETEETPILLEDTAGAGGTIGRSFEEIAALIDGAGGDDRIGVCLDCCHLLASGYDIRTIDKLAGVVDDFDRIVGLDRLKVLHVNDSQMPLGSNRDRHALLPRGELGREGLAAFLSEPRFEGLPALLEGGEKQGADTEQIALARELRAEGMELRGDAKPRRGNKVASKKGSAAKKRPAAK